LKTVFTNGCFDLLHPGHLFLLQQAACYGDRLIVGINSDSSVTKLKGIGRPIFSEHCRKRMLLAVRWVSEVYIFEEPTPVELIKRIKPDILIKGGDWDKEQIAGAAEVEASGGKVLIVPRLTPYSTTAILERIAVLKQRGEPK